MNDTNASILTGAIEQMVANEVAKYVDGLGLAMTQDQFTIGRVAKINARLDELERRLSDELEGKNLLDVVAQTHENRIKKLEASLSAPVLVFGDLPLDKFATNLSNRMAVCERIVGNDQTMNQLAARMLQAERAIDVIVEQTRSAALAYGDIRDGLTP